MSTAGKKTPAQKVPAHKAAGRKAAPAKASEESENSGPESTCSTGIWQESVRTSEAVLKVIKFSFWQDGKSKNKNEKRKKNNTAISYIFTQFPLMITSCKTAVYIRTRKSSLMQYTNLIPHFSFWLVLTPLFVFSSREIMTCVWAHLWPNIPALRNLSSRNIL